MSAAVVALGIMGAAWGLVVGGTTSLFNNVQGRQINAAFNDKVIKDISTLKATTIGAVLGGAIGAGLGYGIDDLFNKEASAQQENVIVLENAVINNGAELNLTKCSTVTAESKANATFKKDANGDYLCVIKNTP